MSHLTLDDIYEIAQMAYSKVEPSEKFQEKISHIKNCDKCFKLYALEYSIIKETTPISVLDVLPTNLFANFRIEKDETSNKIFATQEYAQDVNWHFEIASASKEKPFNYNKKSELTTILQNTTSKYSQIILKEDSVCIFIKNDSKKYTAECVIENGEKLSSDFIYDEREDMLVAKINGIPATKYILSIFAINDCVVS